MMEGEPTVAKRDAEFYERAYKLYEVEAEAARHYERLRLQTTSFVLGLTGVVAAAGPNLSASPRSLAFFLLTLAVAALLISVRLSHAHAFHSTYASKMRWQITASDLKLMEKRDEIGSDHARQVGWARVLSHRGMWAGVNFLVPSLAALAFFPW